MRAPSETNELRILLVGDTMFNEEFLVSRRDSERPEYYLEQFKATLDAADITFANLECTLFNDGSPLWPRSGFQLYSPPHKLLPILNYMNVTVLSMSNNHVYDYGIEALQKAKALLKDNGVSVVGAGANESESREPLLLEVKGVRVGLLAYTIVLLENDKGIKIVTAGKANVSIAGNQDGLSSITADIALIRDRVDLLIVSLHWGYEYFKYPSPGQVELAHAIIDSGADIIAGHHPHCVQGIEEYKNGIIYYSLGNFLFCNHYRQREYPLYGNEFIIGVIDYNGSAIRAKAIWGRMDSENRMVPIFDDNEAADRMYELVKPLKLSTYDRYWSGYRRKTRWYLSAVMIFNGLRLACSPSYHVGIYRKIRNRGFIYAYERIRHKLKNISNMLSAR